MQIHLIFFHFSESEVKVNRSVHTHSRPVFKVTVEEKRTRILLEKCPKGEH
ncbi:unnamed protein product [Oikopleura dioica]|uniref:Uncharacterized protein n=1 Tax=Oikopleura dioica TaxID=34765 RepID=E4XXM3_OIKDI|nr:unnamed protein product [Oikopleura dioica]